MEQEGGVAGEGLEWDKDEGGMEEGICWEMGKKGEEGGVDSSIREIEMFNLYGRFLT